METAHDRHPVVGDKVLTGTLYGLGVGPGDPELLTLKALRILREVGIVAYPLSESGVSLARKAVGEHLDGRHRELPIHVPMRCGREAAQQAYDRAAVEIQEQLEARQDVALLCEGDPLFYGTFSHIYQRLAGRCDAQVVPGVTSINASAAAIGFPIAQGNEVLTILPATLPEEQLRRRLLEPGRAVIMKLGRHLDKVKQLLIELGLAEHAIYLEHVGSAQQVVRRLLAPELTSAPYFSLILLRRPPESLKATKPASRAGWPGNGK